MVAVELSTVAIVNSLFTIKAFRKINRRGILTISFVSMAILSLMLWSLQFIVPNVYNYLILAHSFRRFYGMAGNCNCALSLPSWISKARKFDRRPGLSFKPIFIWTNFFLYPMCDCYCRTKCQCLH